ncbi:MAG: hypothetical protein ACXABY_30370 [Candidatus Thorarchaeota archaeon]|jgi:hypothetical protein
MSDKVFSAENAEVEIYLDDGTGEPSGSSLFTYKFRRASSRNMGSQTERIPHAGYPYDEVSAGKQNFRLDLAKVVESSDKDLFLTAALYYIRVIEHNDDYSGWTQYNCKKCRFSSWNMVEGDTGVVNASARFIPEQIVSADV